MIQPIEAAWYGAHFNHYFGRAPEPRSAHAPLRFPVGPRPCDTITLSRAALRIIDQDARLSRMRRENTPEELK